MQDRGIIQLIANWFYTPDGDEYETYNVGEEEISIIMEHAACGEGDRWFYDVLYKDGRRKRIFNPNSVSYKELPQ